MLCICMCVSRIYVRSRLKKKFVRSLKALLRLALFSLAHLSRRLQQVHNKVREKRGKKGNSNKCFGSIRTWAGRTPAAPATTTGRNQKKKRQRYSRVQFTNITRYASRTSGHVHLQLYMLWQKSVRKKKNRERRRVMGSQ